MKSTNHTCDFSGFQFALIDYTYVYLYAYWKSYHSFNYVISWEVTNTVTTALYVSEGTTISMSDQEKCEVKRMKIHVATEIKYTIS